MSLALEPNSEQGTRYNEGKVKLSLLSPIAQEGCTRVLMFGREKYDAWNWIKGLPVDEVIDSLYRHTNALLKGELIDEDSGLPHVDHIQCNAMFLSHYHHTDQWETLNQGMPPSML